MSSGIYVALSGARAQSQALDSTARNIANASTSGFKAERTIFQEVLNGAKAPDRRQVTLGKPIADMSQGPLKDTGNALDVALQGEGFFALDTERGERYTRDGSFRLDNEGLLVTSLGHKVLDENGDPISFPEDTSDVEITEDGQIFADGDSVGVLKIVNFDAENVTRIGDNMFRAQGRPQDSEAYVVGGSLEMSNFNTVRGVVDVIKVSRTFQALLKMVESYKETESRAARSLGGPK